MRSWPRLPRRPASSRSRTAAWVPIAMRSWPNCAPSAMRQPPTPKPVKRRANIRRNRCSRRRTDVGQMIPAAPDQRVERAGLVYPHGTHVPGDGQLLTVADGVFWLRMPIPFSLDHINLWVLDAGDHWAIVDTGFPSSKAKAFWRALLEGPLAGKPVGRVIVTHYHPDHIGLA